MKKCAKTEKLCRTLAARGTKYIDQDPNDPQSGVTVGFKDVFFWHPFNKQWYPASNDPDKFLITAEDYSTAWYEFWTRWSMYIQRRFHVLSRITIDAE